MPQDRIVWIDLEMTGLDPAEHAIVEIATVITDSNLALVAKGPELVIHQPQVVLDRMNDWCRVHHAKSGLTARIVESTTSQAQAQQQTLDFIAKHCKQGVLLAGNSIHLDHAFLHRHMPQLTAYLHPDLLIDVTTIKELVRRWNPETLAAAPKKSDSHRALQDILESVAELRHYRARAMRAV